MAEEYVSKYTDSGGLTIAYQIWGESEDYKNKVVSFFKSALVE